MSNTLRTAFKYIFLLFKNFVKSRFWTHYIDSTNHPQNYSKVLKALIWHTCCLLRSYRYRNITCKNNWMCVSTFLLHIFLPITWLTNILNLQRVNLAFLFYYLQKKEMIIWKFTKRLIKKVILSFKMKKPAKSWMYLTTLTLWGSLQRVIA